MTLYRKKPIEALQFDGSNKSAIGIAGWVNSHDGKAMWVRNGSLLTDPSCPTPQYHRTHHYCPSCLFTTQFEDLTIITLEGAMRVNSGDWVIKGVKGEFYPCKPDIFTLTYDEVAE